MQVTSKNCYKQLVPQDRDHQQGLQARSVPQSEGDDRQGLSACPLKGNVHKVEEKQKIKEIESLNKRWNMVVTSLPVGRVFGGRRENGGGFFSRPEENKTVNNNVQMEPVLNVNRSL